MSTIITRNSANSGSIPSSLVQGELAINVTDGRLFYGSGSGNVVKEFTGSASGGTIDTGSFAITGSNTFTGDQIINGENLGLIVDASGLKRVGFMKYGGLEGSIARVANQNFRILRTTGSNINDGTDAITDFYIAGDGKVGIGTTSPAYTLDVSGSSNFTDGQTIVGNITFPSGSFISSTNISGNIYISTLNDGILHLNDDGGEGDVWMLNGQNKLRIEGDTIITGSIHQSGTFYPNQIDWFSSSIGYDTGSYILTTTANGLTTYANYQDVSTIINSGLLTTSSFNAYTGSSTSQFEGTASFATNALSASYAISASYEINYETSSSYADFAVSASHALTASFITASNVYGPYGPNSVISASYALTASSALNAQDILIRVLNQSGNPIAKGLVVHITASGNSSDIPRVITASYENDNNSANTLGIANETIANGAEGFVMTEGVLKGIDTSAFVSGQLIYLGATGSIIGTAPVAPLHAVRLGQVVRVQSNNGSIYVRIDNGYEIEELHDVLITSASSGDLLIRSSSIWINSKQLSGSYSITGSLTVSGSSTFTNIGPANFSGSFGVQGALIPGSPPMIPDIGPYDAIKVDDINGNRLLYGSPNQGASSSIDFGNRLLTDVTGLNVLSWGSSGHEFTTYKYNDQQIGDSTRNNLYTSGQAVGQILIDSYFDAAVQDNDLVCLGNGGEWVQVNQSFDSSTRMLGIAKNISLQTGSVFIEGDVVVTTSTGYPIVTGANYGIPVYIAEGAGTTMSTSTPTSGYVRILGHCYYNTGGNEWIMKFRPSNEWIVL